MQFECGFGYTMTCGGQSGHVRAFSFPDKFGSDSSSPEDGRLDWREQKIGTKDLEAVCTRQPAPLPAALPCATSGHYGALRKAEG